MSTAQPAFPAGAYVVRQGVRHLLVLLAALLLCTAFVVAFLTGTASAWTDAAALVFEAGLLAACGRELTRAIRRDVVFAVHPDGVYFGSGEVKENVPWGRICAVEFFREIETHYRSSASIYQCVGVRAPGTRQLPRAGNGPAARPQTKQEAQFYVDAGRPDLVVGADGTVRYAYRRMVGWRVNRAALAAAVRGYAPAVPVIAGHSYPPPVSVTQVRAVRRNRADRRA